MLAPASTGDRVAWKPALLLGAASLVAYLLTWSGHLHSPDEEIQFRTTEAIATRGAFDVEPLGGGFATAEGPDGLQYAQYGIGQPLASLPFYAIGTVIDRVVPDDAVAHVWFATTQYHDGTPSAWKRRAGPALLNSVVTAATVVLLVAVGQALGWAAGPSCAMAALYAFGTSAWPHARTFFSEPLAALLLLASFYHLVRWQRGDHAATWRCVAAGLLAGYGVLVRKDMPLFFPGLVLWSCWPVWGAWISISPGITIPERKRVLTGTAALVAMLMVCLAVQAMLNVRMFGSASALGYEDQAEGIKFSAPLYSGLYGFLFSYGRGMFWAGPALLGGLLGWGKFARRRPQIALGLLLVGLPFFLIMCRWQNWAGGWSWGPRHVHQVLWMLNLGWLGWWTPTSSWSVERGPWSEKHAEILGWLAIGLGLVVTAFAAHRWTVQLVGGLVLGAGMAALLGWKSTAEHGQTRTDSDDRLDIRAPSTTRMIVVVASISVGASVQLFACSQNFIDFYMEYFRTPDRAPSSRALYVPGEAAEFVVQRQFPNGRMSPAVPLSSMHVPAPINDSVYVPQNTAWYGYVEMWREGRHDLFWLHQLGVGDHADAGVVY